MITLDQRNIIKLAVAARDIDGIQIAIDNKDFTLKSHIANGIDLDAQELWCVITRDSVDRDGERILPSAYKKDFQYYLDNPVVLYNHNMADPAVGQMVDHKITDTDIRMRVKFAYDENPFAAMLWKLYSADPPYMRMFSNGFIRLKATNDEKMKLDGQKGLTYTRIEMIELSLVNIAANRYAMSLLPKDLRDDSTLRKFYEQAVEGDKRLLEQEFLDELDGNKVAAQIAGNLQTFEPTELKSNETVVVKIPEENLILSVSMNTEDTDEKEEETPMETKDTDEKSTKAPCPACSEKETKAKRVVVLEKGMNLADTLNEIIGDDDDRTDTIESMASEAGIEASTVNQILNGEIDCPPMNRLESFASALGVSVQSLVDAAAADGCAYDMEGDEDMEKAVNSRKTKTVEIENLKQKYYGYMETMRPEGSFEETKSKLWSQLENYLFKNIPNIEVYDWIDYEIIGTYSDNVIVCVFSREFKASYQIGYAMQADELMLGDMTEVRLTVEPV